MSDVKHSPLPWKVEQYYSSRAVGIVAADNRRIVRSSWNENSPYYPTQAQTYANFYLIASAVNSAAAKDARIAELEAALSKVVGYDDILRNYAGEILWGGMDHKVDATYDVMVSAARAALATKGGASNG